jgi:phospholipid/cholesterol/gamma-HCH transport system substrate-binding protein
MNEISNRRTVMVGLFVLVGLSFLVVGVLMVGNQHNSFKRKIEICSLFDNVGGLQTGNNVWFSGVKIGTVSDLSFYGQNQVAVSLKIETGAKKYIRKDAKVKISTDGIIGNKILIIYGGTLQTGQVLEGDTLATEKYFSSEEMVNVLQENNQNLLAITADFRLLSKKLAAGEGSIGKLLADDVLYDNLSAATVSLRQVSDKTLRLASSLSDFSAGLHRKGTLANELVTDTVVFGSVRASVRQLQHLTDTAARFVSQLKAVGNNHLTPLGVLVHDETAGLHLKEVIRSLERSSLLLEEDLGAVQHHFLFRGYFRKKAKAAQKVGVTTSQ